jgi:hypothetical protein
VLLVLKDFILEKMVNATGSFSFKLKEVKTTYEAQR